MIVASSLSKVGIPIDNIRPQIDDYRYIDTKNGIKPHYALFVGVVDIFDFDYQHIRQFSAQVLRILANEAPHTHHLIMTIHGPGYGLDEIGAFNAQLAGYLDALQSGQLPFALEQITIIEIDPQRVQRLRQACEKSLDDTNYATRTKNRWSYRLTLQQSNDKFNKNSSTTSTFEKVEIKSAEKAHVFVAMPFMKEMDDVFYYGIQQPVHAAGFLCERVDQDTFTGDILDRVKKKIETAVLVIAELSGANPNVYLEVGYAWGKGRPTILLVKNEQELRFDVRGQRCLKYERIKDLEDILHKELRQNSRRRDRIAPPTLPGSETHVKQRKQLGVFADSLTHLREEISKLSVYPNGLNSYSEYQACASIPSQISSEPTTSIATASSITIPYMSWGMRRKRIPQSRIQSPMLSSPLNRSSKRSLAMSFWHASQEEVRRCRQHKHCRQAGHVVPGIVHSNISQLSSMILPFQKIRCILN